jgi:hypothetical protein
MEWTLNRKPMSTGRLFTGPASSIHMAVDIELLSRGANIEAKTFTATLLYTMPASTTICPL